jgi:hypothetical protein
MRRVSILVPGAVALSLTCLLPRLVMAQNKPAVENRQQEGYRRMEIYNGPVRTVAYFGIGLSAGEQSSLRELARAENDLAMNDLVQQLRMQYLLGELNLEARRQVMNPLLYGTSTTNRDSLSMVVGDWAYAFGGPFGGYFGYGYGYGSPFDQNYIASTTTSTTNYNLANGLGNEGVIKTDLAKSLLPEATSEYRARLSRNLDRALAAAGESNTLREKLNIREAAATADTADTVTLKDGTTISGTIVKEDNDWVTIKTTAGKNTREEKVRMSEVARISRADKGIRPASQ